ncbi:MAG: DUF3794 domain-containing protein [Clostridia bacterium]|nr:DUF3794 domain-containing protein [Clostridia bacterium]
MDLNYKTISVCKFYRQIKTEMNAHSDVIVPDTCPDISRILSVNAVCDVTDTSIRKDKVIFSGNVKYNILYSGDTDSSKICTIEHVLPFSHQADLPGMEEGYDSCVSCLVSKTVFDVKNSRKLSVGAMIDFILQIQHKGESDVLCDCEEIKNTPYKSKDYEYDSMIGCEDINFEIEDTITFASCSGEYSVLDINVRLDISDIKAVNSKAVIKGQADIELLYSDGDEISTYNTETGFTEVADMEKLTSDCRIVSHFEVADVTYNPQKSDSDSGLELKVKVRGYICAFEHNLFNAVSDIYSPDYLYDKQCEKLCVSTLSETFKTQDTVKDAVDISDSDSVISKIYHMNYFNRRGDSLLEDGMLKLSGNLESVIIYADEENRLCRAFKSTPYKFEFPCDIHNDDYYIMSDVCCINSGYIMGSQSEIQIRTVMRAEATVVSMKNHSIVTGFSIDMNSPISKDDQPSIVVFYPDSSSDLWEIAKKYNTTCEEIESVNSLDHASRLSYDKPLLIPKRKK